MNQTVFETIRRIVYDKSGINLSESKMSLVAARLAKRLRQLAMDDELEYLERLKADIDGTAEIVHLIDAISTNVTEFFRHPEHFVFLDKQVRQWLDEGRRKLRIWSAASSTGEEPYSIAMTLHQAAGGRAIDMKILATDISTRVLAHCVKGVYEEERVRGIDPRLRQKYFPGPDASRNYQACDDLKRMILFRRLNLAAPPFPMKGPTDVVFCRNVMIYFDDSVRRPLLSEIHRMLTPEGFLIVSSSESLAGVASQFRRVASSIYQKI